jgi:hypothetical protein
MSTEQNRADNPEIAKLVDEFRAEGVPVKVLSLYRIGNSAGKWFVLRPDKTKVNELDFDTEAEAVKYLDVLAAHGYCKK